MQSKLLLKGALNRRYNTSLKSSFLEDQVSKKLRSELYFFNTSRKNSGKTKLTLNRFITDICSILFYSTLTTLKSANEKEIFLKWFMEKKRDPIAIYIFCVDDLPPLII